MAEVLYYAGVGSQGTPESVCHRMAYVAEALRIAGWILNSGGADGADTAFERGCGDYSKMNIFLPWDFFNHRKFKMPYPIHPGGYRYGELYHPVWARLTQGIRKMMARNAMQVLGHNLTTPVRFVLCWTKDGITRHEQRSQKSGGTGHAISIASTSGIPVINMNSTDWLDHLEQVSGVKFTRLRERLADTSREFYFEPIS